MNFTDLAFRRVEELRPAELHILGADDARTLVSLVHESVRPEPTGAANFGRRMDIDSAVKAIEAVAVLVKVALEIYQTRSASRGAEHEPADAGSGGAAATDLVVVVTRDAASRWPLTDIEFPADAQEIVKRTFSDLEQRPHGT